MLEIRNLSVNVGDKRILDDIDMVVPEGELHVLLGPNGSGKSSLLASIMGLPPFEVVAGDILFDGKSLQGLNIRERAALGMGLGFQRPPNLDGVSVSSFAQALAAEEVLAREAEALDLADFVRRDMNVGFSGGEIKRWEVLKLILQDPRLMLFDEPESGVDLEHVRAIGKAIGRITSTPDRRGRPRSGLVITHTGLILKSVDADLGYILKNGRLLHSGEPRAIFSHIQTHGYTVPEAG
ncbi:MAG: ATP-binding cassette domain-containing protein [Acidobacteriota bacterium]